MVNDNKTACNQLLLTIGNPEFYLSDDTEVKNLLEIRDATIRDLKIVESAEEIIFIRNCLKM